MICCIPLNTTEVLKVTSSWNALWIKNTKCSFLFVKLPQCMSKFGIKWCQKLIQHHLTCCGQQLNVSFWMFSSLLTQWNNHRYHQNSGAARNRCMVDPSYWTAIIKRGCSKGNFWLKYSKCVRWFSGGKSWKIYILMIVFNLLPLWEHILWHSERDTWIWQISDLCS